MRIGQEREKELKNEGDLLVKQPATFYTKARSWDPSRGKEVVEDRSTDRELAC
jgi:hypothetical protein